MTSEKEEQTVSETKENRNDAPPSKARAWFAARKSRIVLLILASAAFPLVFFVTTPFDIFANNREEFVFVWADFMPWALLAAFGMAVLFAAVLLVLPQRAFRVMSFVLLGLAFLLFLQGTFLNSSTMMLAGDDDAGSQVITARSVVSMTLNLYVWVTVLAVMIGLALRNDPKGYIRIASYILGAIVFATQIMNCVVLSISDKDVYLSYAQKEAKFGKYYATTEKNLTDFATERNVYYILVDRFDARYAEQAYKKHADIYDGLTGFTWFTDALSLYAHTYPSVSYMLTNRMYDAEKKREDYLSEVYYGDDLPLAELSRNGYRVNLYTQSYYVYNYNGKSFPDYVDNFSEGYYRAEKKPELFGRMLLLSAFRLVPQVFKTLGGRGGNLDSSMCNRCVSFYGDDGNALHDSDNYAVYKKVHETTFTSSSVQKNFTFLHLDGCHNVHYTEDFRPVRNNNGPITNSVVTSMKVINAFVSALKEKGLYKDATIIITGDHPGDPARRSALTTFCRTALFVKPRGVDGGAVRRSSAQVSHEDVWATIMKSEGIDSALTAHEGVFDVAEGVDRARRFINHTYMRGNLTEYYYNVFGSGDDFAHWKLDASRTKHYKRHIMD